MKKLMFTVVIALLFCSVFVGSVLADQDNPVAKGVVYYTNNNHEGILIKKFAWVAYTNPDGLFQIDLLEGCCLDKTDEQKIASITDTLGRSFSAVYIVGQGKCHIETSNDSDWTLEGVDIRVVVNYYLKIIEHKLGNIKFEILEIPTRKG